MNHRILSSLCLLAFSSGLVACSGPDDAAKGSAAPAAHTDDAEPQANPTEPSDDATAGANQGADDASAGADATGSGGSNTKGSGGSTASGSGGSGSRAGSGGSSGTTDDAGSAGADDGVLAGPNEKYDLKSFKYVDSHPGQGPIGNGLTMLESKEEIMLVAPAYTANGKTSALLFQEAAIRQNTEPVLYQNPDLYEQKVWDVARGDFDGNHVPEVASASLVQAAQNGSTLIDHLQITLFGKPAKTGEPAVTPHTLTLGAANEGFIRASLAVADIDADGRDEVLVSAVLGSRYSFTSAVDATGARLYVLRNTDSGLEVVQTTEFAGSTVLRVLGVNLDDDAESEFAILEGSGLTLRDDVVGGGFATLATNGNLGSGHVNELVTGNFDDDPAGEVAWIGVETGNVRITTIDDQAHAFAVHPWSQTPFQGIQFSPEFMTTYQADPMTSEVTRNSTFIAADIDGDGRDEIAGLVLEGPDPNLPPTFGTTPPESKWMLLTANFATEQAEQRDVAHGGKVHLASIQDDTDPARELLISHADGSWMSVSEYDPGTSQALDSAASIGSLGTNGANVPFIAGGDFDGDNMLVRYLPDAEPRLTLAKPMVLIALAAPPTQAGIEQAYDSSSTVYSKETSSTHSVTSELSLSVGATLGFEAGLSTIVSVEMSASITAEMTKSQTDTVIETRGVNYSTTAKEDAVLFAGNLFRIYTYVVEVSADANAIGKKIEVNVPIDQRVYLWPTAWFNETFPAADTRIGTETFVHTPYDVASYHRSSDLQTLKAASQNYYTVGPVDVAGSGPVGLSLGLGNETTQASSYSYDVTLEAGLTAGGVSASVSAGVGQSHSVEVTLGSTSTYEGSVGNIGNMADFNKYGYGFGLVLHDVKRGNVTYPVVDYWVEPFTTSVYPNP